MSSNSSGREGRLHLLAIAIGVWLIVAPFILVYESLATTWNEIITGVLVASFGALYFYRPNNSNWTSWGLGGLGIWLMLSPFLFGYGRHVSAYWNELGIGIILIILAFGAVGHSIRSHSHLAH